MPFKFHSLVKSPVCFAIQHILIYKVILRQENYSKLNNTRVTLTCKLIKPNYGIIAFSLLMPSVHLYLDLKISKFWHLCPIFSEMERSLSHVHLSFLFILHLCALSKKYWNTLFHSVYRTFRSRDLGFWKELFTRYLCGWVLVGLSNQKLKLNEILQVPISRISAYIPQNTWACIYLNISWMSVCQRKGNRFFWLSL